MMKTENGLPVALMAASGFAGLGYQIVWTQQGSLWLGHESAAVLAVVAAFFGGLAVGALGFGPAIERSERPRRWYAGCELLIAAWSLLLALLMPGFGGFALALIGEQPSPLWQWTVAFLGTFLLLLPATAAMGATLPAMERLTASLRGEGRTIARLYAGNTFGAVLGVLAAAFWLVPELGLRQTAAICIALNLFCAAAAWLAFPAMANADIQRSFEPSPDARRALLRLAFTGLLGIGYEVLVVRVLSQVAEDTVYTFALLLAVYLVGSAIGAAAYARWKTRIADSDRLLAALAIACLLGTGSLWAAEQIKAVATGDGGMAAALGAEALLAVAAFGLPTLVMGALFSHLCEQASTAGISFGRALGVNTLGAALAPFMFGLMLRPLLGPKLCLLLIAAAYLLLMRPRSWRWPIAWAPAAAAAAIAIAAPALAFVDLPEGGRIVSYRDGAMAAVSVVEDAQGVSRLRINNRQQEGSSSSRLADARQALLPMLLHPAPERALFLGLGTGMTASSAAQDLTLQVDAVELLPEVVAASGHFTEAFVPSRLHLITADARRYVRATDRRYDLIVADNFHPARSGSAALYTVEHFAAVRDRLNAGGLFCQWLPLHQLDLLTLRSIVRSFMDVYPGGTAILASNSLQTPVLGLVAHADGAGIDAAKLREHLRRMDLPDGLDAFGIEDEFAVLGGFVAGPASLAAFAGDAPANTDDKPIVAYRAPRITYVPDSTPAERLVALLQQLSVKPGEVLADAGDTAESRRLDGRLTAYWTARNRFLEAGRDVRPSGDVREMLAQVREPLLTVLHTSADFRPAYDPLVRMAMALGRTDPAEARGLLAELARVQATRPEARAALLQLGGAD